MNKQMILAVLVIILIGGLVFVFRNNYSGKSLPPQTTGNPSNASSSTAKNTVQITNFSFSPSSLTVKAGDKVTWTNSDSVGHTVTADDNSFDTGVISQGQTGSVTFSKPGTFTYHCSVHPTMKAEIIVQ